MNSFVKFCLISLAIALVGFGCFVFVSYKDVVLANIADTTPYPFYNGNEHLIAHAGGIIDGHVYTNSREAVEASIGGGGISLLKLTLSRPRTDTILPDTIGNLSTK